MPTESTVLPTTETPVYQCRHVFTDGHRCDSRALRAEAFCYYHHQTRKPAPRQTQQPQDPNSAFDLPLPRKPFRQDSLTVVRWPRLRKQMTPLTMRHNRVGALQVGRLRGQSWGYSLLIHTIELASNARKSSKHQPPATSSTA